jgi:hypothetical protein
MKKISTIAFLVLAVAFLAGCGKKQEAQEVQQNKEAEKTKTEQAVSEIKGAIVDAIRTGKPMECTYTLKFKDMGTSTSKVSVEGKKYKTVSEISGSKQVSVFDGNTLYSWSEADKKGTKMTKICMEELNKDSQKENGSEESAPAQQEANNPEDLFSDLPDAQCASVASIDFSIPTDVEFSDTCEQAKEAQEKNQNMRNFPIGGIVVPEPEAKRNIQQ